MSIFGEVLEFIVNKTIFRFYMLKEGFTHDDENWNWYQSVHSHGIWCLKKRVVGVARM